MVPAGLLSMSSMLILVLSKAFATAKNDSNVTPYMPIVVPLAVRSPYLSAYLTGRSAKNLATMSPHFWTGAPLGWTGLVRVDGHVWNWMGNLTEWPAATNTSFVHTSSSSVFTFATPNVSITASFLSPVTPSDILRQSLPFSYLSLTATSLDGASHQVELYTDVNGLWLADEEEENLEWEREEDTSGAGAWKGLRVQLADQQLFQESSDRILYGSLHYATRTESSSLVSTFTSAGESADTSRALFASVGSVGDAINSTFRSTRTRNNDGSIVDEPCFAISHSLGMIGPSTGLEDRTVVLAIGHMRDPVVQYMTPAPSTGEPWMAHLRPLWASRFTDVKELITWVLNDFDRARRDSAAWDSQLEADAKRVHGQEYADIVAVSTRQIFQSLEAVWDERPSPNASTDTRTADGTAAMVMMKEISSNGNVQTVDVLAPFLPFVTYANPALGAMLLEPVLRYSATAFYRMVPPTHDLGDSYPNATGRNDFSVANLPLEESGNMLSMMFATVKMGKGLGQARGYYGLLKQWAAWMETNTLYPTLQRSTDDFFGLEANQTSLVIKGLVGLAAMAGMADLLGYHDDHIHYQNLSISLTEKFLVMATSKDQTHLVGTYSNSDSWVTQYNMYLDKLLGTDLFPKGVYDMQDTFYLSKAQPYGIPLDSRKLDRAKTDWLLWTAGASSGATRDMLVNAVAHYFHQNNNAVFGDLITPADGWSVGFLTRPVVGGHFSLLALDAMQKDGLSLTNVLSGLKDQLNELKDQAIYKVKEHPSASTLGFIAFVICIGSLVFLFRHIRRARRSAKYSAVPDPEGEQMAGVVALSSLRFTGVDEPPGMYQGDSSQFSIGNDEPPEWTPRAEEAERDAEPLLVEKMGPEPWREL